MKAALMLVLGFVAAELVADPLVSHASWYGDEHRGRLMANGRPFNPDAMTAASWSYPLGTRVRVISGAHSVVVTITDRGPAWRLVRQGRIIDLSRAAFARLADTKVGLIHVFVYPL